MPRRKSQGTPPIKRMKKACTCCFKCQECRSNTCARSFSHTVAGCSESAPQPCQQCGHFQNVPVSHNQQDWNNILPLLLLQMIQNQQNCQCSNDVPRSNVNSDCCEAQGRCQNGQNDQCVDNPQPISVDFGSVGNSGKYNTPGASAARSVPADLEIGRNSPNQGQAMSWNRSYHNVPCGSNAPPPSRIEDRCYWCMQRLYSYFDPDLNSRVFTHCPVESRFLASGSTTDVTNRRGTRQGSMVDETPFNPDADVMLPCPYMSTIDETTYQSSYRHPEIVAKEALLKEDACINREKKEFGVQRSFSYDDVGDLISGREQPNPSSSNEYQPPTETRYHFGTQSENGNFGPCDDAPSRSTHRSRRRHRTARRPVSRNNGRRRYLDPQESSLPETPYPLRRVVTAPSSSVPVKTDYPLDRIPADCVCPAPNECLVRSMSCACVQCGTTPDGRRLLEEPDVSTGVRRRPTPCRRRKARYNRSTPCLSPRRNSTVYQASYTDPADHPFYDDPHLDGPQLPHDHPYDMNEHFRPMPPDVRLFVRRKKPKT